MKKIIILITSFMLLISSVVAGGVWYYDTTVSTNGNTQTVTIEADQVIVFSLDKQVETVEFSTDSMFTIRTLEGGEWIDMSNNIEDYYPLRGYMVRNLNSFDLNITFTFKSVAEAEKSIFQKTLKSGWNLVGPAFNNDLEKKVEILDFLGNSNFSHLLDFTGDSLVYSGENNILTKKTYSGEVPILTNTAINHIVKGNSQLINSNNLNNIKVIEGIAYGIFVPNETTIPGSQGLYDSVLASEGCDEVSQLLGLCGNQEEVVEEIVLCDEVSQLLGLCGNKEELQVGEVSCSSDQVFADNSCNTCYYYGEKLQGDHIGLLSDLWINYTNTSKILFKEEQANPGMINLDGSKILWEMTPSPENFWEYTSEFNALYNETYEGYVLGGGESVTWIKSGLSNTYKLKTNNATKGSNIGLLVYPISTYNILEDGEISMNNTENKECVLFKSAGASNTNSGELLEAPTNISITNRAPESISLTWDIVNTAANYKIYYGTGSNSYTHEINTISNSNSITVPLLNPNNYYYFVVTSIDENLNESDYSNEVSGFTDFSPANSPTNVQITNTSTGSISLSWDIPLNATHYTINYGVDEVSATLGINTMSGITSNNATIENLEENTTYYFSITALNQDGNGNSSSIIQATTINSNSITNFQATNIGTDSIDLSWDLNNNIYMYYIKYGTGINLNNESDFVELNNINIANLEAGNNYSFQVIGLNENGEENYSSEIININTIIIGTASLNFNDTNESINVLGGTNNLELAEFSMFIQNEDLKINDLNFNAGNTDFTTTLKNVRLVEGETIISNAIITYSGENTLINFKDTFNISQGSHIFKLIADTEIFTDLPGEVSSINGEINIGLDFTSYDIKGINTNEIITINSTVGISSKKTNIIPAIITTSVTKQFSQQDNYSEIKIVVDKGMNEIETSLYNININTSGLVGTGVLNIYNNTEEIVATVNINENNDFSINIENNQIINSSLNYTIQSTAQGIYKINMNGIKYIINGNIYTSNNTEIDLGEYYNIN